MSSRPIELVAREAFGFEALWPGQREAIESVLAGNDTLVVMPPGAGKSAIHHIAGVIQPGVTVVICPSGAQEDGADSICVRPEEFESGATLDRLRAAEPTLIVVDDAHCVSGLAEDFDPDYLRLGAFIAEMGHPPVLALTHTAPSAVREEIVNTLHMHDPTLIVRD